jgi:hypothetical protein
MSLLKSWSKAMNNNSNGSNSNSSGSAPLLPSLLDKNISPRGREVINTSNNSNGNGHGTVTKVHILSNGMGMGMGMGMAGIKASASMDEKMSDVNEKEEVKIDRTLYDNACGILTHVYGNGVDNVTEQTKRLDHVEAEMARSSLLFGEVAPHGVDKMLDDAHLNASNASVLYDLGSFVMH